MNGPELLPPPSSSTIERIRQLAERRLTAEEFEAYVNAPMSDEERQEILASIAWFKRRYPTPAQRLAAARRGFRQWTQHK